MPRERACPRGLSSTMGLHCICGEVGSLLCGVEACMQGASGLLSLSSAGPCTSGLLPLVSKNPQFVWQCLFPGGDMLLTAGSLGVQINVQG
jgi:hypothetical protein